MEGVTELLVFLAALLTIIWIIDGVMQRNIDRRVEQKLDKAQTNQRIEAVEQKVVDINNRFDNMKALLRKHFK